MNLLKKITAVLSAGIICSTMTTALFTSANTSKTKWDTQYYDNTYYLNGQRINSNTVSLRKDNSSSVYFSNAGYYQYNGSYKYSTGPCSVSLYGYRQGDPYWVTYNVNTCRGYYSLTTTSLYFESGMTRLIRQYVYENGYNGVRFMIRSYPTIGTARGECAADTTAAENRTYYNAN